MFNITQLAFVSFNLKDSMIVSDQTPRMCIQLLYIYSMFRAEILQPASYYIEESDSISCNSGPQSRIAISMTSVWLWEEADTLAQIRTSDYIPVQIDNNFKSTFMGPNH